MKRLLGLSAVILLLALVCSCGDSGSHYVAPPPQEVTVSISPGSPTPLVNQTVQLLATVKGTSNTAVTWSIQETNGGTISEAGLYQAPWSVGNYHVVATSAADKTKSATAAVAVSAKFAFMEYYPGGDAQPISMTPMMGEYKPDGSIAISNVIDPETGNPLSAAITHIAISPDGTKAVFQMATPVYPPFPWPPEWTPNIFIANVDGSGLKQLTYDAYAVHPEWSPDGTKIVYSKAVEYYPTTIWMMNADGTNQHVVLPSWEWELGSGALFPAFSPDGAKIVAEVARRIDGVWWDGIATMNTDGTNLVQLTGDPQSYGCDGGSDEMPAFAHDGNTILFGRYCYNDQYGYTHEDIYTMNADGTNVQPLLVGGDGTFTYSPIMISNLMLFEANTFAPWDDGTGREIFSFNMDTAITDQLTNNNLYDGFVYGYAPPSTPLDREPKNRDQIKTRENLKKMLERRHF
jgi:Tol biopolymer transport system component